MKLHDILKGSDYSLDLFVQASIDALENRIIDKVDKKGKPYYSVNCIIRDKEIKLTPEEVVRQLYTEQLISQYGYAKDRIAFEYPIYFGREAKRADIVIRDADDANVAYIPLIPDVKTIEVLDDEEKFYRFILSKCSSVSKLIRAEKDSDDYNNTFSLLSRMFQFVINKTRNELDLYNSIYREKFRENPTENETKEWFFEFSYSLRNVLFHRVVDPFDKKWTNIVKYASQALYDIVVLNIEKLKTM